MSGYEFTLSGEKLVATPEGALWLPDHALIVVSDLHLGKANRIARREGRLTPPYEVMETLTRLADVLEAVTQPLTDGVSAGQVARCRVAPSSHNWVLARQGSSCAAVAYDKEVEARTQTTDSHRTLFSSIFILDDLK